VRAVQVTRFGGPDVLRLAEVERPSPISTEVLVRVLAAGVNPVDAKTRRGEGVSKWMGPPPFVPGWDIAGEVVAIGYGVTRFRVGDMVFGMPRFPRATGAYAEYVAAPSRQLASMPRGLSAVEAAALPLAALTAWQCLADVADVDEEVTVLIHGASGGVGDFAVQIARFFGARVVTTGREDRAALSKRDVDVALDLVGGEDTRALLETLRPGGLLLAVADGAPDAVKVAAAVRGVQVLEPLVEPDGTALEEIRRLVETGRLKVRVEEAFPLDRAAAAHERLERGGVRGKLVLEVSKQ
jgi:NADPH:quinone reductase-like Zn-dependent oxidoreductase